MKKIRATELKNKNWGRKVFTLAIQLMLIYYGGGTFLGSYYERKLFTARRYSWQNTLDQVLHPSHITAQLLWGTSFAVSQPAWFFKLIMCKGMSYWSQEGKEKEINRCFKSTVSQQVEQKCFAQILYPDSIQEVILEKKQSQKKH